MKLRHNDSGSCTCILSITKNGSFTSLKRIMRKGSRPCKLPCGSNIPLKQRKLLDKLAATRADYNKHRSKFISSSEQEVRSLRRDDAEGPNVLELRGLVDKGGKLGHNELAECCSCCFWDPLMAHHTHTKKQRHGHAGRARTVRAEYSSRSIISSRLKELRPHVRFNAKNVHSDPCTCTTNLSAVFKRQSVEMVNKLLQNEKQRSMPSESFARQVANKRNKRPFQKYLQKIKHSETKMKQALQDGAKKSLKKIKQSKSIVMDRQHYEISTELIRSARDKIKRQKRAGSKSSEELEAKLLVNKANLDRKIKSEARNTTKKISKIVKKSKLKLRQSVEPLIRKSAERIQELEAKRKLGQHMCECPGIQAELTKMAKRNLDKHRRIPAEILDFDTDIQEPKVSFNRKMKNEIKKSARKVADLVQDSQATLRENVEVLAKKSVERIKQLDAQRKLLQKTVCECPKIKAKVVMKGKQRLNRRKVQSEIIPILETIEKPLKYNSKMNAVLQSSKEKNNALTDAVKESKTKFKKIVSDRQKANETSTSETNLENTKRFKIRKDSKEKYKEALVKKKTLKDWECEPPCFSEKCIPQECYEKIIIRKAKLAEMRNINRLGDKQMVEKSLSDLNTQLGAVKKKLKKLHRSERKRNRAVKATKNLSKTSGVGVEANQLEKTKGTNVKKKFVKKGDHSKKETSQSKDNQTKKLKPNSVHSMTKFGNAKHAKTSSENTMRSVSSSASEPKKLRSEPQAKRRAKPKYKRSMMNIKHVKPTQRGKKTQDRKQHIKSVSNLVNMKNKTKATKTLNKISSTTQERNISEYEIPSSESKVQRKIRDRDIQTALKITRSHFTQSQNRMSDKLTTTKRSKKELHKCLCSIKIGTNQYKRMKVKKKGTLASDQSHWQILRSSATDTKNAPFEPLQHGKKLKRRFTNTIFDRRSASSGTFYRNKKSTSSFTSRSAVFPKNKNVQSAAVFRKSKRSEYKYPEAVMSHPEGHGRRSVRISSSFSFSVEFFKDTPQVNPRYIVDKSRTAKRKPNERQKRSQGDGYTLHKRSRESQHAIRRNASKEKGDLAAVSLKRCFCTHKLLKSSQNKFNRNKPTAISGGAASSLTRATVKQHLKKYFSKDRRSKTAVPTVAVYRQQTYTVSRVAVKDNKKRDGKACLTVPQNQQQPALQPGCFSIPQILSTGSFSIGSIAGYPLNELLNLKYYQDANKTSTSTTICLVPKENHSHFSLESLKSYALSGSFLINNNEIYGRNKLCEKQAENMIEPPFLKRCVCTVNFQVPGEGNGLNKRESDEFQPSKCESGECVPYNYCSPFDCREIRLKKTVETGSTILGKKTKQVPSTCMSKLGVQIVHSTQISLQHSVFGVGSLSETQTVYRQNVENPYKRKRRRPKLLPYECEPGICIPGESDPNDCLKLIRKRRAKGTESQWGGGVQTSSTAMPLARQTESQQIDRSRKKERGSYQRRHAKDGMNNEQYFTTTNNSAKPPRRGVRIGSQFSFNIDFSKSTNSSQLVKTEYIEQNYEKEDNVRPKKIKKRNRDRGSQNERKRRHRRSQSDQSLDTSSTMTNNMLKRFPGNTIMNESGTQSTSQVRKRPFRNRRNRFYRHSFGLDPNECEPGFCTPGYCDPYKCLKKIQERNTKVNTDSPRYKSTGSSSRFRRRRGRGRQIQTSRDSRDMMVTTSSGHIRRAQNSQTFSDNRDMMIETTRGKPLRHSQMQTLHIEEPPVSYDRSSGKQTVRIGSSFSFNMEFSKDASVMHTASRGSFAPGVEYRHGSSGMDRDRYRSKMTSPKREFYTLPDENKYKIRHAKRTGDTKTGLGPLLKRCFCTLAFKKGNLEKFAKVHTSASTDTREHLKEPQNYARNERTNTRKQYFRGGQKLMPYECEPGVCTPGECDPYECLKRIERRSLYSRGTDPVRRQYRGRGSASSQNTMSRGIKANRRPQQKHRNVGMGRRRQNTVGTASSFNSMSKGTKARRQDRRHRRDNTIEGIHYDRPTNVQSSPVSNRRTVRIGSNFSFNIEISKGVGTKKKRTVPMNLEKGMQYEGNNMRDTGVYGGKHLRDSYSQADYCTENKNVGTFLKRCFCTINIQKNRARKQVQTKKPYGRYLRSASIQSNLKMYADNVSHERGAETRNQMYSLEPYECEPNVCIPGECNPYDCYERIQRRLRDQGVASKNVLRELGTRTGNLDVIYTQPDDDDSGTCDPYECYYRMRNRRSYGTECDGPSDISIGTMPYNTNSSAASQYDRMRRREEGSVTYRNPNREFGSSPYGSHEFGSSPMGSHEFASSPREISSNKRAVKISSDFSFNVEFFKDEEVPTEMHEPARPKRDRKTRAVHTKRRRANRGVGERIYGRNNESQMDNSRRSSSTQHDSILKRCFCTLKLQQEQPHKRLITRYPNDQQVYMVETATKRTTTKKRKQLQKLEPYEPCDAGFCVPKKCNPQVCPTRIKHRNSRRVTIGTVHTSDQRKHEKLQTPNVVTVPRHPNYFSKTKRVASISSSIDFKIEFLKDESHIFEDQNENKSMKKKQTKLSRFFKGSRSKNRIVDQKQFLKNDRFKLSTKKKPVDSKREAIVNTKDTFDNKKEISAIRKNQNDIKVDSNKGQNNKQVTKTQKRNTKRSQISKPDIKVDGKKGLKNEQLMKIESQKDLFVNTKDSFCNNIGTVVKRKVNKSVVKFAGYHDYREYPVVSTETKDKLLQTNEKRVQKTRETLSSGKNKHASYITDGVGKKKKRSQKNEEIDEKKIQADFKPRNKKHLYKKETSQQLTKSIKQLKRTCVCSPSYCNTEALKKSCLIDCIASSETKKIQITDKKLPKDRRVITVGRVAIEHMSSKYLKQSKNDKLSDRYQSSFSKEIVTILPYNSKMLNCSRKTRLISRKHCHPCLKIDNLINSKLLNGNPESVTNLKQLREIREFNNNNSKILKYNNLKGNHLADAEKQTRSSGIKKVLHRFACFFSRQQSTSSSANPICDRINFNIDGKSTKIDPQPETKICPHSQISKSLKNYKTHRKNSREKHQRPVQHQKQFHYKHDSGDSPQLLNELKDTSKESKHVLTSGYCSFNNEKSKAISPYAKDYIVGYCGTFCMKKDGVYKCASSTSLNCNCNRINCKMKQKLMPKMKKKDKVRGSESNVTLYVVKPPPKISKWDYEEKWHPKKGKKSKRQIGSSDEPHGEWLSHVNTNHKDCVDCVNCCEEHNRNSPIPILKKLKSNKPIFEKKSFSKPRLKSKYAISSECLLCPECIEMLDSKYTKSLLKPDQQRCKCVNKLGSESLRCLNCRGTLDENYLQKNMMNSDMSLRCPNCHDTKERKGNKSNMIKANKPLVHKEFKCDKLNIKKKKRSFHVYRCSNECDIQRCERRIKKNTDFLRCPACGELIDEISFLENKIGPDVLRCPNCHSLLDANFVLKECRSKDVRVVRKPFKKETLHETHQKGREGKILAPKLLAPKLLAPKILTPKILTPTKPSRYTAKCKQNALLELQLNKSTYNIMNKSDTTKFLKRLKDNPSIEPCDSIKKKTTFSEKFKHKFIEVVGNLKRLSDVICNAPKPPQFEIRLDSDGYCILNKEQTAKGLKKWQEQEAHTNDLERAKLQLRSLFKRSTENDVCICKARVCDEEVSKLRRKLGMRQKLKVPCTCGSQICRRRALHAAKRKLHQQLHGKGIPRQEYEAIMKYIQVHRRQPSLKIVKALLKGKHRKSKKLSLSKRVRKPIDSLIDKIYEYRADRKIASQLQKVARRRHRYYKRKMSIADRGVVPGASNALLLVESALDLIRLGGTLTESGARLAYRTAIYPSRTYRKMKDKVNSKPKRVKSKTFKTAQFVTKSTLKRVNRRILLSTVFPIIMRAFYRTKFGTALVSVVKSKLYPKQKQGPPPRIRDDKIDYGCSLFMGSMRKKPCMWVYELCPWFYPHCITIVNFWKQFTNVLLFLLAIVIWSPCICVAELCRGLLCCSMCTQ